MLGGGHEEGGAGDGTARHDTGYGSQGGGGRKTEEGGWCRGTDNATGGRHTTRWWGAVGGTATDRSTAGSAGCVDRGAGQSTPAARTSGGRGGAAAVRGSGGGCVDGDPAARPRTRCRPQQESQRGRGGGGAHDQPAAVRRSRAREPYAMRSRRAPRGDRLKNRYGTHIYARINEAGGATGKARSQDGGARVGEEGALWVPT